MDKRVEWEYGDEKETDLLLGPRQVEGTTVPLAHNEGQRSFFPLRDARRAQQLRHPSHLRVGRTPAKRGHSGEDDKAVCPCKRPCGRGLADQEDPVKLRDLTGRQDQLQREQRLALMQLAASLNAASPTWEHISEEYASSRGGRGVHVDADESIGAKIQRYVNDVGAHVDDESWNQAFFQEAAPDSSDNWEMDDTVMAFNAYLAFHDR